MCKRRFFASLIYMLCLTLALSFSVSASAQDDDELSLDDEIEFSDDESDEDDDFSDLDDEDFEDFEDELDGEEDESFADTEDEDELDFEDDEGSDSEEVADDEEFELEPDDGGEDLEVPAVDEPEEDFAAEEVADTGGVPDEPNLEHEARLYDIFVNFHSQKTPEEEWQNIVGDRASERYEIQKGDTLWDISGTIFGDGNYWPKVWSLNGRITNPHLIKEGSSIGFLLGNEDDAPAFTVTEEEEEVEVEEPVIPEVAVEEDAPEISEEDEAKADYDEEAQDDLIIPPPSIVSRPVLKNLPPSLPYFILNNQRGEFDDAGISYGKRKISSIKDEAPMSYYISEAPVLGLGQVSEIEEGSKIASAFQYIYVNVKTGDAQVGDSYLVVNNKGEVEKPNEYVTGEPGHVVEVQGIVQLIERVDGRNESEHGALFRAIVKEILNPVSVGSILIEGKIEVKNISDKGPRSQVVSQIIGGQFTNRRQVYSVGTITYLNRGTNDGLKPGHVLSIRSSRVVRNEDTLVEGNIRPIGWLKIIKTTPNYSTAVIIRSWSAIYGGDVTGSGMLSQVGQSARFDGPSDDDSEFEDDSEEEFEDEFEGEDEEGDGFDEGFDEEEEFLE